MSCCPVKLQLDFDNSTKCSKIQASCKFFFAERERERERERWLQLACDLTLKEKGFFLSVFFFLQVGMQVGAGRGLLLMFSCTIVCF